MNQWGIDVNVKAKLFKDSQIQSQAQLMANSLSRGGKSPLIQQPEKQLSPTPTPHVPQISAILSNQFTVEQYMKAGVGTTGNTKRSKDNSLVAIQQDKFVKKPGNKTPKRTDRSDKVSQF